VLFVDDNPVNCLLGVTLLEEAGYEVETAEDGLEAVEAVKQGSLGMIFMDVQMPNMDGIEATRIIRGLPNGKGATPIVAVTANAMVGDREALLRCGMDDYLSKPLDPDHFLAAASRWTGSSRALAQGQDAATSMPVDDRDVIPLLDEAGLGRLRAMMPATKFLAIIQKYIESDFLVGVGESAAPRDFPALGRMVHNCKGISTTLGASRLRAIAGELELACSANNASAVSRLLPELRSVINLTRLALRDFCVEKTPCDVVPA
jgi:CheY-like chemotaxis protein